MYCWLCYDILFSQYYLIPTEDNYCNKSQIIKKEGVFNFVYNVLCENCLDMYLTNYPNNFNDLCKRELTGKKINKKH